MISPGENAGLQLERVKAIMAKTNVLEIEREKELNERKHLELMVYSASSSRPPHAPSRASRSESCLRWLADLEGCATLQAFKTIS